MMINMMFRGLCALAVAGLIQGQDTPQRLTFEVAKIKPTPAGGRRGGIGVSPGGQTYIAQGSPVRLMISLMYKIPIRQITGGPDWLDDELYDVEAKADHSYNLDDLHTMFQNLLTDEFKLKFHKENREGNVYALTIDKSGLKMRLNESEEPFKVPIQGAGLGKVVGKRVPMVYLCWWLSGIVQRDERPVINKTGLDKNYDFNLAFAPEFPPGVERDKIPAELLELPTIFTALREQLGLKLEAQKGPVEFYVIDHVERPAAN
jgi:uncharacterized protein (TIGR03435 family)